MALAWYVHVAEATQWAHPSSRFSSLTPLCALVFLAALQTSLNFSTASLSVFTRSDKCGLLRRSICISGGYEKCTRGVQHRGERVCMPVHTWLTNQSPPRNGFPGSDGAAWGHGVESEGWCCWLQCISLTQHIGLWGRMWFLPGLEMVVFYSYFFA